jgi:RepB plasmid partitioning protein/ParB-like nuclease family protein
VANSRVRPAFNQQVVVLPIDVIVPQKELSTEFRKSTTYKRISSSLEHIGLIEPIVVYPRGPRDYLLLDGHARLDILKRSGATEVRAIFAMDDEAYTYNKKVNHAPPVAEHFMMLKALSHGATEERLAQVLNVSVSAIRQRRGMLDGICEEAVEILRNSHVCAGVFAALKKMKPIRQIEAAEQMHAAGTYSVRFAQALFEVTRPEFLAETALRRKPTIEATSKAAQAMLEQETDLLIRELKAVEESYGTDMLTLSIACGYIERLLANSRVEKHLEKHHPDILGELRRLLVEVKPPKDKNSETAA